MGEVLLATCPKCGCKYVNIKEEIKVCRECTLKSGKSNTEEQNEYG